MVWLLFRSFLWALFWGIVAPIVAFAALAAGAVFNPFCDASGNASACALGTVAAAYRASAIGFVLGFLVTLVRGLWRRERSRGT